MNLFNIIKSKNEYWLVDQIKREGITNNAYRAQLNQLLKVWKKEERGYLSILIDEAFENELQDVGFEKISSIVEYTRKIADFSVMLGDITAHSLASGFISAEEYRNLYEICRSGSANKNKQQPIDQVMESIGQELGKNWKRHCYYFDKNGEILGISIPHIETGTIDEGRLFYFGVVPKIRGKGIGTKIHQLSLMILKELGASYYVGSTDVHNEQMINIFKHNGCKLRDQKGIYRIKN